MSNYLQSWKMWTKRLFTWCIRAIHRTANVCIVHTTTPTHSTVYIEIEWDVNNSTAEVEVCIQTTPYNTQKIGFTHSDSIYLLWHSNVFFCFWRHLECWIKTDFGDSMEKQWVFILFVYSFTSFFTRSGVFFLLIFD